MGEVEEKKDEPFFTEKQKEFIRLMKRGELKRINILYGSVRSGKTWICLLCFALWVATMPKEKTFLLCARTLTSLKRNCLDLLTELVGERNFAYSLSGKVGTLFGHKVYLEGCNDGRAEAKIRGMTLQGAYIDEITLISQDFFSMLLSRLSERNARLFGSTNPDSPNHWLKVEFLDRADELDMYVEKYQIDDNIFLDPEYVKQIKSEYTGVFYKRYIEGDFCLAEGIIYPMFEEAIIEAENCPKTAEANEMVLSLDYGTQNAFAALLWVKRGGIWYAVREYYYSGRAEGIQKTDEEYAQDLDAIFDDAISRAGRLRVIVDPSAASFIVLLRKREHRYVVVKADNDVLDGIRDTATAMHKGLIKISRDCKATIKEFSGYVWDNSETVDRPIKVNDHAMDAMRYFVRTMHITKVQRNYISMWG